MNRITRIALALMAVLAVAFAGGTSVSAEQGGTDKVVVCKYVGTPGEDERLQTGQNPIVVSVSALEDGFDGTFPFAFSDAQGRSIAIRYAENSHDGDISECPGYTQPSEVPSSEPSTTPSEAPSTEPSAAPSDTPSEAPSNEPTSAPSKTPICDACGGPGEPSLPNTAAEPTDATATHANSAWLLLLAAALAVLMLVAPAPRRSR